MIGRPNALFVIWPPLSPEGAGNMAAEHGEMAEWSKARAWKVRIPVKGYRGFESLSLRHRMAGGEAAGMDAMATSRACSGKWTAQPSQGRNGRGHAMKPPPMGKADRREANPFLPISEAAEACFGERTARKLQGRNGRGHAMKLPPTGKADRREADPSFLSMATSRACSGEWTAQPSQGRNGRGYAMKLPPTGKADQREADPFLLNRTTAEAFSSEWAARLPQSRDARSLVFFHRNPEGFVPWPFARLPFPPEPTIATNPTR